MSIKSYAEMNYHPINEKLLTIIRTRTNNTESDLYFRVLAAFFMSQAASNMRTKVHTPHRGVLPCNMYALLLGESGLGKGHSLNVLEDEIFEGFTKKFLEETMPEIAKLSMEREAIRKCQNRGTDFDEELSRIGTEYAACGEFPYTFDSGTGPAYRQARTAAQIADIGALTLVCDEIGTNLLQNSELFAVNLEAYDIGKIKQKLIKNTSDNRRSETRHTPVPSNMLCFGTPIRLFNGGREEAEIQSLFETGYGRRFMFGIGIKSVPEDMTGAELIKLLTSTDVDTEALKLARLFTNLADPLNYDQMISMPMEVAEINADYQLMCERKAEAMSEYDSVRKAEMAHRYFRAIKLATVYAWVDGVREISPELMYNAIKLVEDSGEAFKSILTRPKNYARLAKYIAEVEDEVTHADMVDKLSYYPSAKNKQEEMLTLATAWGYKNNIIIKRNLADGIEFFKGESLKENNLDSLIISYSTHDAYNYINKVLKWDQIDQLCQANGYHWVNHFLNEGHRADEDVIAGFNLICIDVDSGICLKTAKEVLKDYTAYFYTTKRHQALENGVQHGDRFRIILPIKYNLKMSKVDFKEFMNNVLRWMPFGSDDCSNQRSKKWLCNTGQSFYNDGILFDPLPFIPRTQKAEDMKKQAKDLGNLSKVEQFFAKQWNSGRNNTLLNYGMMLIDSGMDLYTAQETLRKFNESFSDPLTNDEINNSVFKTMSKASTAV